MIGSTLHDLFDKLWPMLTIFTIILFTVRIYYLLSNHKKIIFYKEIFNYLFLIYILLLFELVTTKKIGMYNYNIVPFKEIFRYEIFSQKWYQNVLGNIILFIPVGYFISRYANAKKATSISFISFIISLTIEIVQYKIGRAFDIDDILLNTLGGSLGYLIHYLLNKISNHLPGFLRSDTFYNILTAIILILLILLYINDFKFGW